MLSTQTTVRLVLPHRYESFIPNIVFRTEEPPRTISRNHTLWILTNTTTTKRHFQTQTKLPPRDFPPEQLAATLVRMKLKQLGEVQGWMGRGRKLRAGCPSTQATFQAPRLLPWCRRSSGGCAAPLPRSGSSCSTVESSAWHSKRPQISPVHSDDSPHASTSPGPTGAVSLAWSSRSSSSSSSSSTPRFPHTPRDTRRASANDASRVKWGWGVGGLGELIEEAEKSRRSGCASCARQPATPSSSGVKKKMLQEGKLFGFGRMWHLIAWTLKLLRRISNSESPDSFPSFLFHPEIGKDDIIEWQQSYFERQSNIFSWVKSVIYGSCHPRT